MKKLPDAELEIMLIIWNAKKPVTRSYIEEKINESKSVATTTVLSFLSRLEKKGFIEVNRKDKSNLYSAVIEEDQYIKNESKSMLEKFYNNSIKDLVAQLCDTKSVSKKEIDELKKYLDEYQEKK